MGIRLPFYGYINPHVPLNEFSTRTRSIEAPAALLRWFMTYMSRVDVQKLKYGLIGIEGFDPENDRWNAGISQEVDATSRPVLAKLIRKIGEKGTIVVPSLLDLRVRKDERDARRLIDAIDSMNIPVLALQHDEHPLDIFMGDVHADANIFGKIINNTLCNRGHFSGVLTGHQAY